MCASEHSRSLGLGLQIVFTWLTVHLSRFRGHKNVLSSLNYTCTVGIFRGISTRCFDKSAKSVVAGQPWHDVLWRFPQAAQIPIWRWAHCNHFWGTRFSVQSPKWTRGTYKNSDKRPTHYKHFYPYSSINYLYFSAGTLLKLTDEVWTVVGCIMSLVSLSACLLAKILFQPWRKSFC